MEASSNKETKMSLAVLPYYISTVLAFKHIFEEH